MANGFFRRQTKRIVILANIITAILFLLGSYSYLFNPRRFWFIGMLNLSAFYLLLILIGFAVFWFFVKPRRALISAAAILLALKPTSHILPFRFSHSFATTKADSSIRVMTWNVAQFNVLNDKKDPAVKNDMLNLINYYQPDIACFQEMVAEDGDETKHGHIRDYVKRLGFADYLYSYNEKEDFWGHAHFGIIIFSKYPIINKKTVSPYPHSYNSIFQYIDILKGTDTIRVFNIHLQSLRFSRTNLKYIDDPTIEEEKTIKESRSILGKFKRGFLKRQEQADRIRAELDQSPYPVILTGDFNDLPNSYAYHTIGGNMQNAFVEKGAGLGRTFSSISPVLRIDNIFADRQFTILQYERVGKKLSDHFPLISDLQLEKK